MDKVSISIIMPVYNPGIYFEECLQSIFAQTFTDFELICVNDASKDKLALQLLETYPNRYPNMRVLQMEQNVGAGESRNRGLQEAVGEYVIFLDADDVYAKEMLERMHGKCVEEDADVCICGYTWFDAQDIGKKTTYEWKPNILELEDWDNEKFFIYWAACPWNKLCKRDFLVDNNIFFQSLSSYNDVFFSFMVGKKAAKKAYITDLDLIKHRDNIPTQISATRDHRNLIYSVDFMINELKRQKKYDEIVKTQLMWYLIICSMGALKTCRDENKNREFYSMVRDCLERIPVTKDHSNLYTLYYNYTKLPYESRWFENKIDFFSKIRSYSEDLQKLFQRKNPLFLWGLGKRGEAFQKFCKEVNLNIDGVADIKNENIGSCTEFGNKIFSTYEIVKSNGCIVASNESIYNELIKMRLQADVINLEEYCPD